jgi:hypothetical protein
MGSHVADGLGYGAAVAGLWYGLLPRSAELFDLPAVASLDSFEPALEKALRSFVELRKHQNGLRVACGRRPLRVLLLKLAKQSAPRDKTT